MDLTRLAGIPASCVTITDAAAVEMVDPGISGFRFADDILTVERYIPAQLMCDPVRLVLTVKAEEEKACICFDQIFDGTVALRLPPWLKDDPTVKIDGEDYCYAVSGRTEKDRGYALIAGPFEQRCLISVKLPGYAQMFPGIGKPVITASKEKEIQSQVQVNVLYSEDTVKVDTQGGEKTACAVSQGGEKGAGAAQQEEKRETLTQNHAEDETGFRHLENTVQNFKQDAIPENVHVISSIKPEVKVVQSEPAVIQLQLQVVQNEPATVRVEAVAAKPKDEAPAYQSVKPTTQQTERPTQALRPTPPPMANDYFAQQGITYEENKGPGSFLSQEEEEWLKNLSAGKYVSPQASHINLGEHVASKEVVKKVDTGTKIVGAVAGTAAVVAGIFALFGRKK